MRRERGSETLEMLLVAATVGLALLSALAPLVPLTHQIVYWLLQSVQHAPGGFR